MLNCLVTASTGCPIRQKSKYRPLPHPDLATIIYFPRLRRIAIKGRGALNSLAPESSSRLSRSITSIQIDPGPDEVVGARDGFDIADLEVLAFLSRFDPVVLNKSSALPGSLDQFTDHELSLLILEIG